MKLKFILFALFVVALIPAVVHRFTPPLPSQRLAALK